MAKVYSFGYNGVNHLELHQESIPLFPKKGLTTLEKSGSPGICVWEDVREEEGELITSTTYFDEEGRQNDMTAHGATLAELMKCVVELTSWPASQIQFNVVRYNNEKMICYVEKKNRM